MDATDLNGSALLASAVVLLAGATSAAAQTTGDEPAVTDETLSAHASPWRVELNFRAWFMGVDGDIGLGQNTVNTSATFVDILDNSDSVLAFSGRLEIGYERFGAFVDGFWADLGMNDQLAADGVTKVDVTFEEYLIDFGGMYRVLERTPTGRAATNGRDITVDLYAGGRYVDLDLTLRPQGGPPSSGGKDWIDPIVGTAVLVPLARHWHVEANGDVGGFGVNSDFTWSATGVIGFDFKLFENPASVYAGYRAIGWDYETGSGDSRFEWNVIQHGPAFGFELRF